MLARHIKSIETRPYIWRGMMPCPFAIHASNQKHSVMRDIARKFSEMGMLGEQYDDLPFGAVVGCGVLSDCVASDALLRQGRVSEQEIKMGDFSPGRFGWVFSRMEEIDPIAMPGRPGPWPWRNVGSFEVPDWFVEFKG